jgi:hypothetical protein
MSSHTSPASPWPQQTQQPAEPVRRRRTLKRKRIPDTPAQDVPHHLAQRQIIADESEISQSLFLLPPVSHAQFSSPDRSNTDDAMTQCQISSGNDVVSCFPTSDTTIPQDQWATFVCAYSAIRPLPSACLAHHSSLQGTRAYPNLPRPTWSIFIFSTPTRESRYIPGRTRRIPPVELVTFVLR